MASIVKRGDSYRIYVSNGRDANGVTISEEAMALLRRHKAEQQRFRLAAGTYWKGDNYIFTQDDGRQMDISTPNKVFQKNIRRYYETEEGKTDPLPMITLHLILKDFRCLRFASVGA